MSTQISIEVWRDSARSADVRVYRGQRRIDRVTVIPGDCLDLELEDDQSIVVSEDLLPNEDEVGIPILAMEERR